MQQIDWKLLSQMPGSKDVGAKKFAILEASLKIISDEGIQALTITKISKEVGISKSLVLYHYDKIEKIIEDLFFFSGKMARFYIEKNLQDLTKFEERIMAMVKAIFEWVIHNKNIGEFFILMYHEANKTEQMQVILKNILNISQDFWQRIFLESMRYRSLEEVQMLTMGIHNLITGTMIKMISTNEEKQYQDHQKVLIFNLERLLQVELQPFQL